MVLWSSSDVAYSLRIRGSVLLSHGFKGNRRATSAAAMVCLMQVLMESMPDYPNAMRREFRVNVSRWWKHISLRDAPLLTLQVGMRLSPMTCLRSGSLIEDVLWALVC